MKDSPMRDSSSTGAEPDDDIVLDADCPSREIHQQPLDVVVPDWTRWLSVPASPEAKTTDPSFATWHRHTVYSVETSGDTLRISRPQQVGNNYYDPTLVREAYHDDDLMDGDDSFGLQFGLKQQMDWLLHLYLLVSARSIEAPPERILPMVRRRLPWLVAALDELLLGHMFLDITRGDVVEHRRQNPHARPLHWIARDNLCFKEIKMDETVGPYFIRGTQPIQTPCLVITINNDEEGALRDAYPVPCGSTA